MHEDDIIQTAGCTVMPLDYKSPRRSGYGVAVAVCNPNEIKVWQFKADVRSRAARIKARTQAIETILGPPIYTEPWRKTPEKSTKPIKLSMISRIYNKLTTFFN
jgi:hypothetical protein